MSMCRCDCCSRVIDSDYDLDCFIDRSGETTIACAQCRERMERVGEIVFDESAHAYVTTVTP